MDKSDLGAEILLAAMELDAEDKLLWEKYATVLQLIPRINAYIKEGFSVERVVRPIAMKKLEFIKAATKKSQLAEILKPTKVRRHPNGEILPDSEYAIPEEELVMWAIISPHTMLITSAQRRIKQLFKAIYPEYADKI